MQTSSQCLNDYHCSVCLGICSCAIVIVVCRCKFRDNVMQWRTCCWFIIQSLCVTVLLFCALCVAMEVSPVDPNVGQIIEMKTKPGRKGIVNWQLRQHPFDTRSEQMMMTPLMLTGETDFPNVSKLVNLCHHWLLLIHVLCFMICIGWWWTRAVWGRWATQDCPRLQTIPGAQISWRTMGSALGAFQQVWLL